MPTAGYRARKHIAEGRRRRVDAVEQRRLLDTFIAAAQKGELAPLEASFLRLTLSPIRMAVAWSCGRESQSPFASPPKRTQNCLATRD